MGCSHSGGIATGPSASSGGKADEADAGADAAEEEEVNEPPRWHTRDSEANERTGLYFEDAYLQCFDDEVEIGIYAGDILESWGGMGDVRVTPNNRVEIRNADGEFLTFDENIVASTDGAGNDTFQVLFLDSYGVEIVLDLHYDHELGHLAGHWSEPVWYGETHLDGFDDRHDVAEEMNCYDYTYGDL